MLKRFAGNRNDRLLRLLQDWTEERIDAEFVESRSLLCQRSTSERLPQASRPASGADMRAPR
jgi:hypothetical protein